MQVNRHHTHLDNIPPLKSPLKLGVKHQRLLDLRAHGRKGARLWRKGDKMRGKKQLLVSRVCGKRQQKKTARTERRSKQHQQQLNVLLLFNKTHTPLTTLGIYSITEYCLIESFLYTSKHPLILLSRS